MIRVEPVSETCMIVYLGEQIDTSLTPQINLLARYLKQGFAESLIEVIPSYTSLFIQYHPRLITYQVLSDAIMQFASMLDSKKRKRRTREGKLITLPVYYDPDVGPDLLHVAREHNLEIEQVIASHVQKTYTVCAVGFAPGFAFLASVEPEIATPRHAEPRMRIPAGSVGIANEQTAVYPADSPGGWQIIGNCPTPLFSPESKPMSPFKVGDRVKFEAICRREFEDLGGSVWPHWK